MKLGLEELNTLLKRRDNIFASTVAWGRNGSNQKGGKGQKLEHV